MPHAPSPSPSALPDGHAGGRSLRSEIRVRPATRLAPARAHRAVDRGASTWGRYDSEQARECQRSRGANPCFLSTECHGPPPVPGIDLALSSRPARPAGRPVCGGSTGRRRGPARRREAGGTGLAPGSSQGSRRGRPTSRNAGRSAADQVAVCAGRVLGKPGDARNCREQLQASSGQAVEFHTAAVLHRLEPRDAREHVDLTIVRFRSALAARDRALCRARSPFRLCGRLSQRRARDCPVRGDRSE